MALNEQEQSYQQFLRNLIWFIFFGSILLFTIIANWQKVNISQNSGGGCSPPVSPVFKGLRLDLLMKANKYIKDISNVEFAYSDTNCRLKVRFKNRVEESFDSMEDLISKVICLEGQYKKLLVLMFYVCLQFAKYCKICCMFLLLLRAVVGCVLYWGCSQRFRQIRGEGTCGRIFF